VRVVSRASVVHASMFIIIHRRAVSRPKYSAALNAAGIVAAS